MSQNTLAILKSKLAVYTVCYLEAKKSKDLKRMVLLGPIINDLQNEIGILEEQPAVLIRQDPHSDKFGLVRICYPGKGMFPRKIKLERISRLTLIKFSKRLPLNGWNGQKMRSLTIRTTAKIRKTLIQPFDLLPSYLGGFFICCLVKQALHKSSSIQKS